MQRTVNTSAGRIDYELIQTQRKSMEIRLSQGGSVRLFAPRRAPLKLADAFVQERAQWIQGGRAAMREAQNRRAAERPLESGATLLYEGEPVELRIRPAERNQIRFDGESLLVFASDTSREALVGQLQRWLTEQARERIGQRLDHFIPLVGRAPGRIAIRDQKTRWGSCSSQHNLNFNWKLIMAPPEALDYVVVHELCHLYDFNHSPKFWARVKSHQEDYLIWKAWLKANGKLLGL